MHSRDDYTCSSPLGPSTSRFMETPTVSPSLADASIDYMRSSSSNSSSSGSNELDPIWTFESSQGFLVSDSPISSPSLSCPPSWIFEETELEEKGGTDNDDEISRIEVPYSSSPPDLANSSRSNGSPNSQSRSSDVLKSNSADSRSDTESVVVSEPNIALSDPHSGAIGDSFGRKLHQLLLAVMSEQEQERYTTDPELTSAEYQLSRIGPNYDNTPYFSRSPSSHHSLDVNPTRAENSSEVPLVVGMQEYCPYRLPTLSPLDVHVMWPKSACTNFEISQFIPDKLSPMQFEASQGSP